MRHVKYIKKIFGFEKDVLSGQSIKKPFVEVMIIGSHNEWKMFYPLDKFMEINPNIKI